MLLQRVVPLIILIFEFSLLEQSEIPLQQQGVPNDGAKILNSFAMYLTDN